MTQLTLRMCRDSTGATVHRPSAGTTHIGIECVSGLPNGCVLTGNPIVAIAFSYTPPHKRNSRRAYRGGARGDSGRS